MIKLITYLTTYLIIILAELGDKTQVATLIYSSNNPNKRWQVFIAASAALVTCVWLEVTLGVIISRFISPSLINKITGLVFIIIGLISFKNLLKEYKNPVKKPLKEYESAEPPLKGQTSADYEN
jgi:putative Ca2+/H+ antiporter (TMEM165/GDT1 family)